jgi:hypothetical protein
MARGVYAGFSLDRQLKTAQTRTQKSFTKSKIKAKSNRVTKTKQICFVQHFSDIPK